MESSLHIGKESLKFSAAHFTIFSAAEAERLHGHNYRVEVDVWGDVGSEGLIIDLGELKRIVKALCDELDERTLMPAKSPHLTLRDQPDGHVEIRFGARRYVMPREDCVMLPTSNITIETLSRLLCERLREALRAAAPSQTMTRLRVGVEESSGQLGLCELPMA